MRTAGANVCVLFLLGTLLGGCVSEFDRSGHRCPCVPGWECLNNECVPTGTAPVVDAGEPQADAGVLLDMELCGDPGAENILKNASFESYPSPAVPTTDGVWGGDPNSVVRSEGEVQPSNGEFMLRFDRTGRRYVDGAAAQMYQLVDVSNLGLAEGDRLLGCSHFNRVAGSDSSDSKFGLQIWGFPGSMEDFSEALTAGAYLFGPRTEMLTDANPSTWQRACLNAPLAAADLEGLTYLAVEVRVIENVRNDPLGEEFDGHYVDDVCFSIMKAR